MDRSFLKRFALPAAFLLIVGVIFLRQALRINRLESLVVDATGNLTVAIEEQNGTSARLSAVQQSVASDLSEVRRLMNLSPGTYAEFPASPETASEDRTSLFFSAVERIETEQAVRDLEIALSDRVGTYLENFLGDRNFSVQSAGRFRWRLVDGETNGEDPQYRIEIVAGRSGFTVLPMGLEPLRVDHSLTVAPDDIDSALEALTTVLLRALETQEIALRNFQQRAAQVDEILTEIGGEIKKDDTNWGRFEWILGGEDGTKVSISLNDSKDFPDVVVDAIPYSSLSDAREALFGPSLPGHLDEDRGISASVRRSLNELTTLSDDPAFLEYLTSRNLRIESSFRDSQDFIYMDLFNIGDDSLYGTFAVHRETGKIFVTDHDEIIISDLIRAGDDPMTEIIGVSDVGDSSGGDSNLPNDFPVGFQPDRESDGINILLFGIHENRADTIMIAHISSEKEVALIGIPRDIWWHERKLNLLHEMYGAPYLVDQIEEMTQIPVDGWLSIDMYAFIELVDILGGIDVTLAEPLIDPTYRVRNGGRWETLYYPAGTHHLNGIEALRVARSRHTSNDFERSSRQQLILNALRRRLNELNAGDLDRVYQLVDSIFSYIDSSYSAWELAQLYLAYRNAEIVEQTGLTFDNVLYTTWSNLYLQGLTRDEVDDDFYLGEWILLPRGGDWNVIPWFIQEHLP